MPFSSQGCWGARGRDFSWVCLVAVFIASLWVREKSCWRAVLGVSLALVCHLRFPYTGSWFSLLCRMIALQLCHCGSALLATVRR